MCWHGGTVLSCISTSAKWSNTLTSLSLYKVTLKSFNQAFLFGGNHQLTLPTCCSLTQVERCSACAPRSTPTAGSSTSSAAQNRPSPSHTSPPPPHHRRDQKMHSTGRPSPGNTCFTTIRPCLFTKDAQHTWQLATGIPTPRPFPAGALP